MRLIDANALIKDIADGIRFADEWEKESYEKKDECGLKHAIATRQSLLAMISRVKEAPTLDPEVQHGEWHESWHTDTVCASICTNCGKATTQSRTMIVGQEIMNNVRYPLCPYCGARMDGGC